MTTERTQYENEDYSFYYEISSRLKCSIRHSRSRCNSSLFKFGESALRQAASNKSFYEFETYYNQFNNYELIGKIIQNYFIKLSKYIFGGSNPEGFYSPDKSIITIDKENIKI